MRYWRGQGPLPLPLMYHGKTTSLVTWLVNPLGLVRINRLDTITRQVTPLFARFCKKRVNIERVTPANACATRS